MNLIAKKIFASFFFLIIGLTFFLGSIRVNSFTSENLITLSIGIVGIGFGILLLGKVLIPFIKNPRKFLKKQKKEEEKINKSNKFLNKGFKQEKTMFFFIIKSPLVWGLYLFSFILVFLFFYSEFYLGNAFVGKFLVNLFELNSTEFNFLFILSFFFCYSFIILSIILLPYLFLGEYYQKKIKNTSTNIFLQVIIDFIYSIPYLIIWSFLWAIFMLIVRKRENVVDTINSFSIYAIITSFSYWTYYSLAKIAYDDRRTFLPVKNPRTFYKQNGKEMFAIWVRSGYYFAIPFIIFMGGFFIIALLGLLFSEEIAEMLFPYLMLYIGIPSFIILFLGTIISSQLNVLNYSIKESENLSEDFVLNLK